MASEPLPPGQTVAGPSTCREEEELTCARPSPWRSGWSRPLPLQDCFSQPWASLGSSREDPSGAVRGCSGLILPCGSPGQSPTLGCAAAWPSCRGNLDTGQGPLCDEEQSRQAVGRAARTRRSGGSTMAVAVRAAGKIRDAERGLLTGLWGGEKRTPSHPDPLCDLARARTLSES